MNLLTYLSPPQLYAKKDLNVILSGEKASELPEPVFKDRYILLKKII